MLSETTTIRTKNAVTIVSQYPTRHVQIVLRLYKSVSEILTGFDVDCSCVAYDGNQVWAAPRALVAYMTQTNTFDLSRRSPSYENRLSKYSHRGFEVYWPLLDRSKVDPTIFERSFSRVMGLARLLVFEKLPGPSDRDAYLAKRREERGRPPLPWNYRFRKQLPGNVKDSQPDDVAEWVEEDEASNYHTFTIPYGPKYNARKIERLLYTKDLLLNAEWNQPRDRETSLHRHPAFFGSVDDVIHDCCGFCPEPVTDEDLAAAEVESKIYISGNISFVKDDPGRQEIGSFNPLTDNDWTEMAYVGNTARLCQAIVDGDIEHVEDWCKQEGADANRRDHTGRTPLHLAAMSSTPEIVQCLINHGARLVARLVDGSTALHIAARRGNVPMVKAILQKSEANEEEEARKEDLKKEARRAAKQAEKKNNDPIPPDVEEKEDHDIYGDVHMEDTDSTISDPMTEGSFVKVPGPNTDSGVPDAENEDELDVYDVDVLAWDYPVSPLHLAIMGGHLEVIEVLVSTFGADVLLPVKLVNDHNKTPRAAILTLVLALQLPLEKACEASKKLLSLGASSAQADMNSLSTLHYIVNNGKTEILDVLLKFDEPAARRAINHLVMNPYRYSSQATTPLLTAVQQRHVAMVDKLLEVGAEPTIQLEAFVRAFHRTFPRASQDPDNMKIEYETFIEQPIIVAAKYEMPQIVLKLLDHGANEQALPKDMYQQIRNSHYTSYREGKSLLDIVRDKIKELREYKVKKGTKLDPPEPLHDDEFYLKGLQRGTYAYWLAMHDLIQARSVQKLQIDWYNKSLKDPKTEKGEDRKFSAIQEMLVKYETVEKALLGKGAKTFEEMYPDPRKVDHPGSKYPFFPYDYRDQNIEPYHTTYKFLVPDLTRIKLHGYLRLFEAAWQGDLHNVKSLTLGEWEGNRPLQIAVRDVRGFSPFSLAVLRGHKDVAKVILEIAAVQYQPDEKKEHFRYRIASPDEDEDYLSDEDDSERVGIVSELVNEDFTVHDIGALAGTIKSKVSPMELLNWECEVWRACDDSKDDRAAKNAFSPTPLDKIPTSHVWYASSTSWAYFHEFYKSESNRNSRSLVVYAIAQNDMGMLQFLTELGNNLAKRKADDGSPKVFSCSQSDYKFAVSLGRTDMIGHLIKTAGPDIPWQNLADSSGVDVQEKPEYYQGLSVYGKKRKDWADEGRGITRIPDGKGHPPLLSVIFEGNLEAIEYFMSEAPLRRYQEFVASHKDDKRVKILTQAEGGIEKILSTWLDARNNLAIHMAVMSHPQEDGSHPSLDFLIQKMPECIDAKSTSGMTPLQLAFHLNRLYAARTLIAAGANQTTRNRMGKNLIHTILLSNSSDPNLLQATLSLLDQSLIPTMLLERCATSDLGSLTPLLLWIQTGSHDEITGPQILHILLSYSQGSDLEIMDGTGDYPLHTLVRTRHFSLTEAVIRYKPELLYKENAMGMTPIDVLENMYLRAQMDDPPSISYMIFQDDIVCTLPKTFDPDYKPYTETKEVTNRRIVQEGMAAAGIGARKRQLVSLLDANEVAKRLAKQQREKVEREARENERDNAAGDEGEYLRDEVDDWMYLAQQLEKKDLEAFKREFGVKNV